MDDEAAPLKKRRLQGACDECKKRKRQSHILSELKETESQPQGDSATMPGNVCSQCISFGTECTRMRAMSKKKRGPPKGTPRGRKTVQSLVKLILSTTKPYEIPEDPESVRQILVDLAQRIVTLEKVLEETVRTSPYTPSTSTASPPSQPSMAQASIRPSPSPSNEDDPVEDLVTDFVKRLQLEHKEVRQFAGVELVTHVLGDVIGAKPPSVPTRGPRGHKMTRRPEFWKAHSWQTANQDPDPHYILPPKDLMWNLFDLYFTEIHPYYPVLHQGIFRKAVSNGLHHRDYHFAAVVLAVCACASRHSKDPRVFEDNSALPLSAGWKWFRQIRLIRSNFATPSSVYELQLFCSTSTPEACWIMVGVGVRFSQDLGIYRKPPSDRPTIESQLWNRAFCYDLPLPIDCDDEYWEVEDPEQAFKQPEGKPSSMSHWIALLKLMDIVGFAQRTIVSGLQLFVMVYLKYQAVQYAVRKTDMVTRMGMTGPGWNERIVSELDNALNAWADSVPDHLKWTPNKPSKQSTILHITYYWARMIVHKPFLNLSHRSELGFSSLTICANAARSVIQILEMDTSATVFPTVMAIPILAQVILLLNAWRGRHNYRPERELGDVYKCLEIIRGDEPISQAAGRFCDTLKELLLICNTNSRPPSSSLKRPNTQVYDDSEVEEESNGDFAPAKPPRQIAGAKRVSESLFSLPTGTTEIGSSTLRETFPVSGSSIGIRSDDAAELDLFAQFARGNVGMDTGPSQESMYLDRTMAESLSSAFGNLGPEIFFVLGQTGVMDGLDDALHSRDFSSLDD
ncbi:Gypsy retrotransposon integrase-like protein 1 [Marasmius crinis-equi]|uniref:Gypsy retrotransposon integrase-like protein 1 n=1 Tax=Marasmius crinis-equi TaxID=585013 RepID=A0ABR3ETK5_9AGAR